MQKCRDIKLTALSALCAIIIITGGCSSVHVQDIRFDRDSDTLTLGSSVLDEPANRLERVRYFIYDKNIVMIGLWSHEGAAARHTMSSALVCAGNTVVGEIPDAIIAEDEISTHGKYLRIISLDVDMSSVSDLRRLPVISGTAFYDIRATGISIVESASRFFSTDVNSIQLTSFHLSEISIADNGYWKAMIQLMIHDEITRCIASGRQWGDPDDDVQFVVQ